MVRDIMVQSVTLATFAYTQFEMLFSANNIL